MILTHTKLGAIHVPGGYGIFGTIDYHRLLDTTRDDNREYILNMTGRYIRALWRKNSTKVTATFLQGF
jgi:hypothetical protein